MLDYGYDDPPDVKLEAPVPQPAIRVTTATDTYGVFVVEPLPRGFGMTLGNPLRRVLLSSISGAAVNWVRIEGVEHEYSTVRNVKEDVVDILMSIKAVNLRSNADRPGKLRLQVEGPGEVTAGDITMSQDFEIVNPELHIATLDGNDSKLVIEMNVEQGKGYEAAASADGLPIGVLPVDAIYTPVRKVNYTVDRTRVGQHTDYERLTVEVWTNGAVSPAEAVRQAGQELVEHFFRFSTASDTDQEENERLLWAAAVPASQYNMKVEGLNLTIRTLNSLKRASIHKVGEVLEKSRVELLRIRNFGEKSLDELDERLREAGIVHPDMGSSEPPSGSSDDTTGVEDASPENEMAAVGATDEKDEE